MKRDQGHAVRLFTVSCGFNHYKISDNNRTPLLKLQKCVLMIIMDSLDKWKDISMNKVNIKWILLYWIREWKTKKMIVGTQNVSEIYLSYVCTSWPAQNDNSLFGWLTETSDSQFTEMANCMTTGSQIQALAKNFEKTKSRNEPGHGKTCLMPYANNKSADQPAHSRSLISTFVVRCLDSIISLVSRSEISRF